MKLNKIIKLVSIALVGVTLTSTLAGCSDDDSDSSTEVSSQSHKKKLTKKQRINKMVKSEQKVYGKKANVAYSKKLNAITVTPTSQAFTAEVTELLDHTSNESSDWKDLTNAFKDLSITVHDKTQIKDISVALLNPNNTVNALYIARNGETVYDLAKDQNR